MSDDAELLHRYVSERSEPAFAEVVRRHVDLVYFAALRQVGGDTHRAQDVTQAVFADLARKAPTLLDRSSVTGWLHTSTRFAATKVRRADRTRRKYEQEAQAMQTLLNENDPTPPWEQLRPIIDDVVQELAEPDREAVLLRFFEGHAFAEVGAKLKLGEDAARLRVNRALDKMQAALARRGVTSTAAALGIALAGQAGAVAPAGLTAMVTASALAGSAAAAGLGAGASFLGLLTGAKTTLGIAGGVAVLATGAAVYQTKQLSEARSVAAVATQRQEELQARLRERDVQVQVQSQRAKAADEDTVRLLNAIAAGATATLSDGQTATAADGPITREMVESRYRAAQQLARSGRDPATALKELLWCFDEGMPRVQGYGGVRLSFLLGDIVRMGERYSPALAALRERRDEAQKRILAGIPNQDAVAVFVGINRIFQEQQKSLELFDKLPADDPRRMPLGIYVFDQLVASQRYADAAKTKPYGLMTSVFLAELKSQERALPENTPNREHLQQLRRDQFVNNTAQNVEVLAGAGQLESARALTARLLDYDGSEATKVILQQHATRAGHPEVLPAGSSPAP